jgi:hypothetical protein
MSGAAAADRAAGDRSERMGADSVFRSTDNKLHFAGYYKMPAAQTEQENCVAHNGSLIPVPVATSWFNPGTRAEFR